jgi:hypothetical protein
MPSDRREDVLIARQHYLEQTNICYSALPVKRGPFVFNTIGKSPLNEEAGKYQPVKDIPGDQIIAPEIPHRIANIIKTARNDGFAEYKIQNTAAQ